MKAVVLVPFMHAAWVTWFTAALAPALVGLLVMPLIMYRLRSRRHNPSSVT